MQNLMMCLLISMLSFGQLSAAETDVETSTSAAYVSLGDAMVLNLRSGSKRLTFLQLSADILVRDSDSEELITTHIPAI